MDLAPLIQGLFGTDLPVAIEAYDGSRTGPADPPATLVIASPDALRRVLTAPGELGLARAYVAGDLDLRGDIFALLDLRHRLTAGALDPRLLVQLARKLGPSGVRPLPPPPEEARLRGRRHSRQRDSAAIAHHYDVSNDFYRLLLGPTMVYSCALWETPDAGLERAQEAKLDLVCRKLGLQAGQRFLDVGCGWGSLVIHAARHYGVRAVGVTLSERQAELGAKRAAEAGVQDLVEIRVQDERDVRDGPYDAIASIGMFEHVGFERLGEYFRHLHELLAPQGRLLNHGIARPPFAAPLHRKLLGRAHQSGPFIDRYVFPDGELHELGQVVSVMQQQGFEVRHVESLREHYALTLRAWLANLEANWDEAVRLSSQGRARVWRLYIAAAAVNFEDGNTQIHQVLATRSDGGNSGLGLRPHWTG